MFPNRIALAALVVACIAAATGGGYLATRHNVASMAAPDAAAASAPATTPLQRPGTESLFKILSSHNRASAICHDSCPVAGQRPRSERSVPPRAGRAPRLSRLALLETAVAQRSWPAELDFSSSISSGLIVRRTLLISRSVG